MAFTKHLGLPHNRLPSHSDDRKSILPFPCTVVTSSTPRLSTPWCHDYIIRYTSARGRSRDAVGDAIWGFYDKSRNEMSRTWGLNESYVWELKRRSYCMWMIWWKISFLFFFCHVSPIICLHLILFLSLVKLNFSPLYRKSKPSSSAHRFNENHLLQQKMYGCCCWSGWWDLPHQPEPWLIHDNYASVW